jgi:hypothetical protein
MEEYDAIFMKAHGTVGREITMDMEVLELPIGVVSFVRTTLGW